MRHTNLILLIALCMAFGLNGLIAQDEDIPIAALVYMDAPDGSEYVDVEREIWMPIHAQRIREGKLLSWQLYEVVNAMDDNHDFNYLIVEVYPNWEATEAPYADIAKMVEEVHGLASIDYLGERTEKSRSIVKQEYWVWQMGTEDDFKMSDVEYVVADWMDVHPGQRADYLDMERQYYLPVHQKRVDSGKILGWGLWTKLGYSELPGSIDAATTADYASWEDLWDSYPENAWETVHGDTDQGEIYAKMRDVRLMTGSSILRLIDYVNSDTVAKE